MNLTLRYVYGSLLLLSVGGAQTIDIGLGSLAARLSVSRPTLNEALKKLAALGWISRPRSTSSRAKSFDVFPPRSSSGGAWDAGQERLIYGVIRGDLAADLDYRDRMVLALLVSLSGWNGVVKGGGKERLARRLGLSERQFRRHLDRLYAAHYLISYRGGSAGAGVKYPGNVLLNPEKLFPLGWWYGVDLVVAPPPYSETIGWLRQQRISHYMSAMLGAPRPNSRSRDGRLSTASLSAAPGNSGSSGRPTPNLVFEYLVDEGMPFPRALREQFYSTIPIGRSYTHSPQRPDRWVKLAPASEELTRRVDEVFFELSCSMVASQQGRLATASLSKLSLSVVKPLGKRLVSLLEQDGKVQMGWAQRRWLLHQLRFALVRQSLWTWCCLCTAFGWNADSRVRPLAVHRVFPRASARRPVMWLVRSPESDGGGGAVVPLTWPAEVAHL